MDVALAQFGAALGDVEANFRRVREMIRAAASHGAEIICCGYLIERQDYSKALLDEIEQAQAGIARDASRLEITIIYGAPVRRGTKLANTVILQAPGATPLVYDKTHIDIN